MSTIKENMTCDLSFCSGTVSTNRNLTREEKLREWKKMNNRSTKKVSVTPKKREPKVRFEDTLRRYPIKNSNDKGHTYEWSCDRSLASQNHTDGKSDKNSYSNSRSRLSYNNTISDLYDRSGFTSVNKCINFGKTSLNGTGKKDNDRMNRTFQDKFDKKVDKVWELWEHANSLKISDAKQSRAKEKWRNDYLSQTRIFKIKGINAKGEAILPASLVQKNDYYFFNNVKFVCQFFWYNERCYMDQQVIRDYFNMKSPGSSVLLKQQMSMALDRLPKMLPSLNKRYENDDNKLGKRVQQNFELDGDNSCGDNMINCNLSLESEKKNCKENLQEIIANPRKLMKYRSLGVDDYESGMYNKFSVTHLDLNTPCKTDLDDPQFNKWLSCTINSEIIEEKSQCNKLNELEKSCDDLIKDKKMQQNIENTLSKMCEEALAVNHQLKNTTPDKRLASCGKKSQTKSPLKFQQQQDIDFENLGLTKFMEKGDHDKENVNVFCCKVDKSHTKNKLGLTSGLGCSNKRSLSNSKSQSKIQGENNSFGVNSPHQPISIASKNKQPSDINQAFNKLIIKSEKNSPKFVTMTNFEDPNQVLRNIDVKQFDMLEVSVNKNNEIVDLVSSVTESLVKSETAEDVLSPSDKNIEVLEEVRSNTKNFESPLPKNLLLLNINNKLNCEKKENSLYLIEIESKANLSSDKKLPAQTTNYVEIYSDIKKEEPENNENTKNNPLLSALKIPYIINLNPAKDNNAIHDLDFTFTLNNPEEVLDIVDVYQRIKCEVILEEQILKKNIETASKPQAKVHHEQKKLKNQQNCLKKVSVENLFTNYPQMMRNVDRKGPTRFKYWISKAWKQLNEKYGIEWIVTSKRSSKRLSDKSNSLIDQKGSLTLTDIKELKDYVYIPNFIEQEIPLDGQTRMIREAQRHGCKIEDYKKIEKDFENNELNVGNEAEIEQILAFQTTEKKFTTLDKIDFFKSADTAGSLDLLSNACKMNEDDYKMCLAKEGLNVDVNFFNV